MRLLHTALFLFCVMFSKAQTVEYIIHKYFEFIGGEKNWKKVTSIINTGEYNYGGAAFPFTTYSKSPNLYKFIVPFNGKYYAQAFDGKNGWKIDAFKNEIAPTLLEGKSAIAMANEADVELESPLINYKKKGHRITLEGKETLDKKLYYKVKLLRKEGDVEIFYFDTTTFELYLKTAVSKNAEMEGALLNTYLSDYRKVEGLNIPFKLVNKANEQTILTITINEIKLNIGISDSEFKSIGLK